MTPLPMTIHKEENLAFLKIAVNAFPQENPEKFADSIPKPINHSTFLTYCYQICSILFIGLGANYLIWRWNNSFNDNAPVFSLLLFLAEAFSFFLALFTVINYWSGIKNRKKSKPVRFLSELRHLKPLEIDRPITIDIFICTYNEPASVVEKTIQYAVNIKYPYKEVSLRIYLCDDGKRDGRDTGKENFKAMAEQYGINYFCRENNIGYKAGNLNHAFSRTSGDLIVILDADTIAFPKFLRNVSSYFRDKKLAFVQTPQWFYDVEKGKSIKVYTGPLIGKIIPMADKIKFGKNIFGTDPKLFYDIILRKRNAYNASFCCGAGSVHRRDALSELSSFNRSELINKIKIDKRKSATEKNDLLHKIDMDFPLAPFVHHVSEDIYTSLLLHAKKWKSYQHPNVECGMLSPQTLNDYVRQHSRYAEGSLDIFFSKHNPFLIKGLTIWQRLAYFETLFSYLAPFWLLIFLLSPAIFFFTLTPPIKTFNFDFFIRFLSFMFLNIIVSTLGNWGVSTVRSEQYFIAGFWIKLKALFTVVTGKKISFNVTSKTVHYTNSFKHIIPHLIIIVITIAGMLYNVVLIAKDIHPSYSAFVANVIWSFVNFYQISIFIRAAFWKPSIFQL